LPAVHGEFELRIETGELAVIVEDGSAIRNEVAQIDLDRTESELEGHRRRNNPISRNWENDTLSIPELAGGMAVRSKTNLPETVAGSPRPRSVSEPVIELIWAEKKAVS
jgi:hypothetical protein